MLSSDPNSKLCQTQYEIKHNLHKRKLSMNIVATHLVCAMAKSDPLIENCGECPLNRLVQHLQGNPECCNTNCTSPCSALLAWLTCFTHCGRLVSSLTNTIQVSERMRKMPGNEKYNTYKFSSQLAWISKLAHMGGPGSRPRILHTAVQLDVEHIHCRHNAQVSGMIAHEERSWTDANSLSKSGSI
jgi:hypothetical protein